MQRPQLSIIVVSFNMERELPRTLFTLRAPYQQGIVNEEVEILVVDNGSSTPPDSNMMPHGVRLLQADTPTASPVAAINQGLREAQSDFIGVMIDGARLASPGICRYALDAKKLYSRPLVATLGFHLGPDVQMKSVQQGYNQAAEDHLLSTVPWQEDGYHLFSISVFAGSSKQGWFQPMAESNAVFMLREMWEELGGYDLRFTTPGGGLANLDLYVRACNLAGSQLVTLLGEGTFHQVHGGIATNQSRPEASWPVFHQEYQKIRGHPFSLPTNKTEYLGSFPPQAFASIQESAKKLP